MRWLIAAVVGIGIAGWGIWYLQQRIYELHDGDTTWKRARLRELTGATPKAETK